MMEKVMWKGAERTGKRYPVTGNNIPTQGWELWVGSAAPSKKTSEHCRASSLPVAGVRALWSSYNK